MAVNEGITDKVFFILEKSRFGQCSDKDLQRILQYTEEHSDDMVIGRFFGYSVSDYAIASLKWIGSQDSLKSFNDVFSALPDSRKKEINDLIAKKLYLQI